MQQHPLSHWLMLTALVIMWGSAFAMIHVSVETIPPLTGVAGRLILATAILLPLLMIQRHKIPRLPRSWQRGRDPNAAIWGWLFVVAVTGNALPFSLIMWGQTEVDSGLASILVSFAPLVTLVLAHFIYADERLTKIRFLGIILAFAGICILVGPSALGQLGDRSAFWHQMAMLLAAIGYGTSIVAARQLPDLHPLVAGTCLTMISAVIMTPIAVIFESPWSIAPSTASLWAVFLLGLFPTALANILFFKAIDEAGPGFVALSNYLMPLWAVLLGAALFSEQITLPMIIAMIMILGGVALGALRKSVQEEADGVKPPAGSG